MEKENSSILSINSETIKNKKYLIKCRKTIYIMIYTLCQQLTFSEAVDIVSDYYNIKKKLVKKFLKFTIFDNDIVCIIKEKNGKEFLSNCKYLYLLYKTINKIIYRLYCNNRNIKLISCIQAVGEFWKEYDPMAETIVIRAISWEMKKEKSKYKNFYKKYLDENSLKLFESLHFKEHVKKLFKKIDSNI